MRFGTPGYRCPPYCESGEYDATSEIYSLGVVLSELLTGQDGKFYDRDTVEDERLAADERAGQWPAELVLLVWSGPGWWLAV
jgi:serine/threonine protein kinase